MYERERNQWLDEECSSMGGCISREASQTRCLPGIVGRSGLIELALSVALVLDQRGLWLAALEVLCRFLPRSPEAG